MPRRLIYAVLGLALLAAVLWWVFHDDGDGGGGASTSGGRAGETASEGGGGGGGNAGGPGRPRKNGGAYSDRGSTDPAAGGGGGDDPGGNGAGSTRTYVTETGNIVRDHRTNVADPVALPAPVPPNDRTMSSQVTAVIMQKLMPIVRKCGHEQVPDSARGELPVVHVTLIVDVAGGQITTTDASAVTSQITGAAADKVVACVRERASDLTVAANGEPDRTGYVVQYPIRLHN